MKKMQWSDYFGQVTRDRDGKSYSLEWAYNSLIPAVFGVITGITRNGAWFIGALLIIGLFRLTIPRTVPKPAVKDRKITDFTKKESKVKKAKQVEHPTTEPLVTVEDNANEIKEEKNVS